MMKKLHLFFLFIFASATVFSGIINVPEVFPTIQQAIEIAAVGDTILVDEGTYIENLVIPRKELTIGSLYLTTGDTSYISKTIIDGGQNGTVITFVPGEEDFMDNVLTGFTIRNGRNDEGLGGGINISSMASPLLSYLKITHNTAFRGGAIACMGSPGLNLAHSVLSENQATDRGAAILVVSSGMNISHCLITGNDLSKGMGGAIFFSMGAALPQAPEVKLVNTELSMNTAAGTGSSAGAHFDNNGLTPGLNIVIENCSFQENKSIGNTALRIHGQQINVKLANCSFIANEAIQYGAGAVFTGGCQGEVINCQFISNKAATGGGEWNSAAATVWGSEVDFYNCAFVNNSASYGTAMTIAAGTAIVENCILWENSGNPVTLADAGGNGGELFINYSVVQNGQGSISVSSLSTLHWGSSNLDADPLFSDDEDHPYALDPESPCVDAGNPVSASLPEMPQDFVGNIRIWDGNGDESAVIDMGPYEYGSEPYAVISHLWDLPGSEIEVRVFPNPFSTSAILEYNLIQPSQVILSLYDINGRMVRQIAEHRQIGLQRFSFNPEGLSTGTYYFTLEAGDYYSTGKITFAK